MAALVNLGDWLKSINFEKVDYFKETEINGILVDPDQVERDYVPFVINRTLSYFPDTVLFAQMMNERPNISNRMQFAFLKGVIAPKKRYSKWTKNETDDTVEAIMTVYQINRKRAEEYMSLMTDDQKDEVIQKTRTGGLKGR